MAVEERFPITEQGYTVGRLLDGTECHILLDTEDSKSFVSKSHNLCCKSLDSLLMFASKTQRIQVGNRTICECTLHHSNKNRYAWS